MRCLILGGDGMLGHQLLKSWHARHEVRVTLRGPLESYAQYGLFSPRNSYGNVDVRDTDPLRDILAEFQPQAVVNAVGIIKQRDESKVVLPTLEINAVFPHRLRLLCQEVGARLIHVSTDCVFNGRRGGYTEQDHADAEDVYGLSKFLGEVSEYPAITLRSSIIGLELSRKKSLIEWFLGEVRSAELQFRELANRRQTSFRGTEVPHYEHKPLRGYTRAIYSGLTTLEMARVMEMVLLDHPRLAGVWQVASQPISKFELLVKLRDLLGRQDLPIVPDDDFHCDRSLSGEAFSRQTGYQAPSWNQMLTELADQITTEGYRHAAA